MAPRTLPDPPAVRGCETHAAEETARRAQALGERLRARAAEGWVVALEGDLGAGKTLFVRGLARGLGLPPETPVTSPTFTIAQRFDLQGGLELHHLDAYRLGGPADLEAAGWEDAWGEGRVTCVEWAGRVTGALPGDRLEVRLEPLVEPGPLVASAGGGAGPEGDGGRRITLRALGPRTAALLPTLAPDWAGAAR